MSRKILICDTETTSLPDSVEKMRETPSLNNSLITEVKMSGEIIQFCGLLCDLDSLNLINLINFYCMPTEPISMGASNVHKITNDKIKELSNGKHFEDYVFGEYKDIFFDKDLVFASYNVDFDSKVVVRTLKNYGMRIDLGDTTSELINLRDSVRYKYCIMKGFRTYETMKGRYSHKYFKLEEAIRLENLKETVDAVVNNLQLRCPDLVKCSGEMLYHNALYDTIAAWGLLNRMKGIF